MISVWSDGSGTRTEGPACIGVVVLVDDVIVCEVSEHVGSGTNNVAELRAIRRGLWLAEQIAGLDTPVTVYSDSDYAIGVITKTSWQLRANVRLVEAIRAQADAFAFLRFVHVPGHAGVVLNERADELAGLARRRHLESQGVEVRPKRRRKSAQKGVAA